jgi:hypothetical protein
LIRIVFALLTALLLPVCAAAKDWPHEGIRPPVFQAAEQAFESHQADFPERDVMTIVDYGLPSDQPRLFVLDRRAGTVTAYLVAHGRGSDPNLQGVASIFSNDANSHASSLGAFRTGGTYAGKHGLSLKLDGLDPTNNKAADRAIVVHGADYVSPARKVQGRSWGCPAVESRFAAKIIEKIAGGSLLYIGR